MNRPLPQLCAAAIALAACSSPVVEPAGTDAGGAAADAAAAPLDSGHEPPDAGEPASDAAPSSPDGGAAKPDAAPSADAGLPPDAGSPSADGGSATLIFVGDFEAPGDFDQGGTYSQFSDNVDTCEHDQTCTTDSLAIVTSPVRGGSRAVRITLKDGDVQDTSGTRAELQTGSHYDTTLEEDFWYGWSIYVPASWQDGTDQKVVHQWHTGNGNPGGSPIIGLRIVAGAWRITREFVEGDTLTLWTGGAVPRDQWTDWVMHVRWSPGATGHFTAWMNGAVVYTEDGQNMNSGTTSGGHYQKLGMYGSFDGSVAERVLYYDEVRVAKGAHGYAAVAP